MGRRGEHSQEQLKAMAIQAAREIVAESGVGHLSTRKIASRIGYSVGTLYHLFKNLDDIILNINGMTLDTLYSSLEKCAGSGRSVRKVLKSMGLCYLEFGHKHIAEWQLLFGYLLTQSYPDWYREKINKLFVLVENVLNKNIKKPRYHLAKASRLLWSGVHGICSLSLTGKLIETQSERPEKMIEEFIRYFLAGLGLYPRLSCLTRHSSKN